MATITVRGLSSDVHKALKKRARDHGRSMEAEAHEILSHQVRADVRAPNALIELYLASRDNPLDLPLPERTYEPPRIQF